MSAEAITVDSKASSVVVFLYTTNCRCSF